MPHRPYLACRGPAITSFQLASSSSEN
uniref:Uncharacterized protein n=1 Tax=Arundo donax TaxID=35708 RepID=A0A0A9B6W1_ARUDO